MEIIVGKTAGFCYGVKRAVEGAKENLTQKEKIACLGELVHNKQVIQELEESGLTLIDNIEEAKNKVIIRAHGVQKEVYEKASENKVELLDYTCPNVLKIHEIAKEYESKGYFIVLCGNEFHPENIGTISYCGDNYRVIEKEEELEDLILRLNKTSIKKIVLISQTTYSLEKFWKIAEILQKRLDETIELVIKNTICKATEVRQKETEEIAKQVDFMLIIGGKNSSNTKKLYEIAKKYCHNTDCVETKEELKEEIKKYRKVGIMAGASTPKESIDKIVEALENRKMKAYLKG